MKPPIELPTLQLSSIKSSFANVVPKPEDCGRAGLISCAFFLSSNIMQHFWSLTGLYTTTQPIILSLCGLSSAIGCALLSVAATDRLVPSNKSGSRHRLSQIERTIIAVISFAAIEGRIFRTMLPSSVVNVGVFSPIFLHDYRSIPTLSPIATKAQRDVIQIFGRR